MEAYTSFARVYDTFMDNVPYGEWCEYVAGLLEAYEIRDGLVLDLGCGTGSLTELLAEKGYDMIGADCSEDMLEIAGEKKEKSGYDILYLLQDMRKFELYGTVRAVVSICDSMNYIMSEEELLQVFRLVNNYLDPEGIFIFDMNTIYKYRELLGDATIAENREACSFIWENSWYEEERVNEYDLTIFEKEESGLFRKYTETHFQRAYEIKTVKRLIQEAGMESWQSTMPLQRKRRRQTASGSILSPERKERKRYVRLYSKSCGGGQPDPCVCSDHEGDGGDGQGRPQYEPGGDGSPWKASDGRSDDGHHDEGGEGSSDTSDQGQRTHRRGYGDGGQPGKGKGLCGSSGCHSPCK